MGVTESCIRKQYLFLFLDPFCQTFRPSGIQDLFRPFRQLAVKGLGHIQGGEFRFGHNPYIGIPVYGNVPDIMEQLGTTVPAFREVEQFRCFIQEISSIGAVNEAGMLQQVFQESDVGLNTADTEFLQTP